MVLTEIHSRRDARTLRPDLNRCPGIRVFGAGRYRELVREHPVTAVVSECHPAGLAIQPNLSELTDIGDV